MKINREETVARLKILYGKQGENRIFTRMLVARPPVAQARLERLANLVPQAGFPALEQTFPVWEEYLTFYDRLEDDWLPSIYPWQYDQGLAGTLFGARMHVNPGGPPGCASSNTRPLTGKTYAALLRLAAAPDDTWLRRMEADLRRVSQRAAERWGVAVPCTIEGLNLGLQIRGESVFTDLYDCPEDLKRFLQAGVELTKIVVERQRAAIGAGFAGGVCDFFNAGWMPGNAIPMSVDCYNLCRPDVYAEFGLPYQQQLIDHFGGGNFHVHGNGHHVLPHLSRLKGCIVASVNDDGSPTCAIDNLESIRQQAGSIVLVVGCEKRKFAQKLKERSLLGGIYYVVNSVESVAAANRLMEAVRRYRV
jgi:hypothetical protein